MELAQNVMGTVLTVMVSSGQKIRRIDPPRKTADGSSAENR